MVNGGKSEIEVIQERGLDGLKGRFLFKELQYLAEIYEVVESTPFGETPTGVSGEVVAFFEQVCDRWGMVNPDSWSEESVAPGSEEGVNGSLYLLGSLFEWLRVSSVISSGGFSLGLGSGVIVKKIEEIHARPKVVVPDISEAFGVVLILGGLVFRFMRDHALSELENQGAFFTFFSKGSSGDVRLDKGLKFFYDFFDIAKLSLDDQLDVGGRFFEFVGGRIKFWESLLTSWL